MSLLFSMRFSRSIRSGASGPLGMELSPEGEVVKPQATGGVLSG